MVAASLGEIALAIQSAKGTAAASSAFRFPVVSGAPEPTVSPEAVPDVRTTRIAGGAWIPAAYGSGAVAAICRPRMVGALLYAALGAKSVSGAGDPWTHTITLGSVLPYLTVWRSVGGILNERFVDSRIVALTISSRRRRPVEVSFEIAAGSPRYRTAQETTATLEETQHFMHWHGSAALLVEGTAVRSIDDWSLSIDTGVSIEQTLAGPVPQMHGPARIRLEAAYKPSDAAFYRRAAYGSSSPANDALATSVPLILAGSPVGIQFTLTAASGPTRSLRVALPQVALDPTSLRPDPRGGPLGSTLSLMALAPSSGSPITATVVNGVSSY